MQDSIAKQLTEFIQTYKEIDELCHNYAKANGVSDATFYVLYALVNYGASYPQRELCRDWSCPPRAVNSALKALEKRGIIKLSFADGNRKSKVIVLTDKGKILAKELIEPFMEAERNSFSNLGAEEREVLISVVHKYITQLNSVITTIPKRAP